MIHRVNIEIIIDTNANSRELQDEYGSLREQAEKQEARFRKLVEEFGDYMRQAQHEGIRYTITQRDTAQLFHEKTNLFSPELAAGADCAVCPDFLRKNLEDGHYTVEPPIYGEEEYYDALEAYLLRILPDKDPHDLQVLKDMKHGERGEVLQALYLSHMVDLPKKYRRGEYEEDFARYRDVRYNAGEESVYRFLQEYPLPPKGERTAIVFVGADFAANARVARARQGKEVQDACKLEVFAVTPEAFRSVMESLIRDIEQQHPAMRRHRQSDGELAQMAAEKEDNRNVVAIDHYRKPPGKRSFAEREKSRDREAVAARY